MASMVLGDTLDIHSGGIDLKFPHHENELAQSESYYNNQQWVNYFLHSGHLTIQGRTMSKSKKNFITIKESLECYTPRQLRLLFLNHKYNETMEYNEMIMKNIINIENIFLEFFHNIKSQIRIKNEYEGSKKWIDNDHEMNTL
jgi:cysteinyl-tRNA synthetase